MSWLKLGLSQAYGIDKDSNRIGLATNVVLAEVRP